MPDPANPQAWDRYAYVYNNPVRYIDPTGHDRDCALWDTYCRETLELEEEFGSGNYNYPEPDDDDPRLSDFGKSAYEQYVRLRITPGWWYRRYGQITIGIYVQVIFGRELAGTQNAPWAGDEIKESEISHAVTHACAGTSDWYGGNNCTGSDVAILNYIGEGMEVANANFGLDPRTYLAEDGSNLRVAGNVMLDVYSPPDPEWTKKTGVYGHPAYWGNGYYEGPEEGIILMYGDPASPTTWYLIAYGYTQHFTLVPVR